MSTPSIFLGQQYTDRDLIESILSSFYIVDYGFVQKVNDDDTVDVVHAKKLKTVQGETLAQTETKNVEVLTLSCSALSIKLDIQPNDKVLLLGLKDYVENTGDIKQATETSVYMHYSRSTMKALPLCAFDEDSKVTIEIKDGDLSLKCTKFHFENDDMKISVENGKFTIKSSLGTSALEVTP